MLWRLAVVVLTIIGLLVCVLARAWSWIGACWVIAMLLIGLFREPKAAVMGLTLLPLVFLLISALGGAVTFFAGTAQYLSAGYPTLSLRNLDPVSRVSARSTGCMVTGLEKFTHIPNNVVIDLLGAKFGPMPGAYRGPMPDENTALSLVRERGIPVPRSEVHEGRLGEGRQVPMDGELRWFLSFDREVEADLLVLPLEQGGTLIFGEQRDGWEMILIDVIGAQPVTRWRHRGEVRRQ